MQLSEETRVRMFVSKVLHTVGLTCQQVSKLAMGSPSSSPHLHRSSKNQFRVVFRET